MSLMYRRDDALFQPDFYNFEYSVACLFRQHDLLPTCVSIRVSLEESQISLP